MSDERIKKAYDLAEKYGIAERECRWHESGLDADDCFRDLMIYIKGLVARIAELEAAQKEALSLLPELEQGHYYCDDCWYSCPKAVDGCCDERQGDECNCGADNYNALLAKIIGLLTSEVQE